MIYTNDEILKRIENAKKKKAKLTLVSDISNLSINDRFKISLCKHIVQYINEKKIKSVDLCKILNVPAPRVLEIVNYKINAHSIEHLLGYLQILSDHSPRIREYLNLLGVAVEAPNMTASKTKEVSRGIKELYSVNSDYKKVYA